MAALLQRRSQANPIAGPRRRDERRSPHVEQ